MIQKQHSATVDKMTANHDKASGSHGQFFNIDNTDDSFRKKVAKIVISVGCAYL
jgi:hypothetical protein